MTKHPDEYIPKGARLIARMTRFANLDCRSVLEEDSAVLQFRDTTVGNKAGDEDAEEIYEIFWTTFRAESSPYLTVAELKSAIEAGKITIH